MKQINYKCQHCGFCCTHLLMKTETSMYGLYLQKNEIDMFPREHVKPLTALSQGKSRKRPGEIFAYQLDLDVCPSYNAETKQCRIYDKRPMVCRSFPFEGMVADVRCIAIAAQIAGDHQCEVNTEQLKNEIESETKHRKYLTGYLHKGKGNFWEYGLLTQKWIFRTLAFPPMNLKQNVPPHSYRSALTTKTGRPTFKKNNDNFALKKLTKEEEADVEKFTKENKRHV